MIGRLTVRGIAKTDFPKTAASPSGQKILVTAFVEGCNCTCAVNGTLATVPLQWREWTVAWMGIGENLGTIVISFIVLAYIWQRGRLR